MAVPLLPHRVRSSPIIGPHYEAWKTKVLTEGLSEDAIKHEFYIVMKPRWIKQQRQNDKFEADTEKLRKKTDANRESTEHLRTASQHRFAIPIALQGGTLTPLEVLVYGSESGHPPFNKLMRDPQSIVVRTPLVRTDWLGHHGFLVDSPSFVKFITLLYAETMAAVPNQQAAALYELLTSNNNDGRSAFKRIVLRTGEPVPNNPAPTRMAELPHALGDAALSHRFLTTKLVVNAWGTVSFQAGDEQTGAAREYLTASRELIQNDCAYRFILESYKNSWDAYEAKKQSSLRTRSANCPVWWWTPGEMSYGRRCGTRRPTTSRRTASTCSLITSTSTFFPVGLRTCATTQRASRRRRHTMPIQRYELHSQHIVYVRNWTRSGFCATRSVTWRKFSAMCLT